MAANKIQVGYIEAQDGAQFQVDAGTAAAPGLCFDNSAATGLYSPGTGQIAWSTSSKQTALRILADGKVGIDCSPTVALEVNGTIKATAIDAPIEGTLDDWIVHAGDTNTKFGFPAVDTFQVHTSGTPSLQLDSTGRVLIGNAGTYSASGDLHVVGDTNSNGPELYLQVNNNNTTDNIGAIWFGNNVDKSLVKLAGHTHTANNTADFTVSTSSAGTLDEALRITSAGDVGIGYNSPTVKLHVREGASGASSYDNRYHMICENNGEAYLGFYVPNNQYAGIRFNDNTGLEGYIDYYFNTDEMLYSSTAIHRWTTAGSERLRITSDGKVVINKTSGDFDGALHVRAISEDAITIEGSNAAINWRYADGSANRRGGIKWHSGGLVKFDAGVSGNSYYYQFDLNGTERLRIDSSGRLLLGAGAIASPKGSAAGSFDLDNGNITMCIGGNSNSTGRTNSTDKINRVTSPHYTNAEEPVAIYSSYNVSNQNIISYGGGSGQTNAATKHSFYTAGNTTTTTGTERLTIGSDGIVTVSSEAVIINRNAGDPYLAFQTSGTSNAVIYGGASTGLRGFTKPSGGSFAERVRITPDGDVTMQGASGRNFNWDNSDASLQLTDNGSGASARLKIGTGGDLQMYHDVGGQNHITCATNQELKISSNGLTVYEYSGVTKKFQVECGSTNRVFITDRGGGSIYPLISQKGTANHPDITTNNLTNLSSGTWYTIAVNPGNRATGRFIIMDRASSRHTSFTFYAGHNYGGSNSQNGLNLIHSAGTHGTQVFGGIRIKGGGTYDGCALQVYIQTGTNHVTATCAGDQLQNSGWTMKEWINDNTDPGGTGNWSNLTTVSSYIYTPDMAGGGMSCDGALIPGFDDYFDCGTSNRRWDDVYATNGSIQTSDITLKQDITSLTTAEMNAAKRLSAVFKTYRWKDKVTKKGDAARTHTGVIAQTIKTEMEAAGLDPEKYAFYCKNVQYFMPDGTQVEAEEVNPPTAETVPDDYSPTYKKPDGATEKTIYSVRYVELLAFLAAYNEQRFTSIESRLTALEGS